MWAREKTGITHIKETFLIGGGGIETKRELLFKGLMKKNFPEFKKDTLKEAPQILCRINKNKSTPSHIIVQLRNIKHTQL